MSLMRWPLFLTFPRQPDFVVGDSWNPYLRRWWIIPRNKWFNVYLHHFCKSDDDRALHDHPYWNVSILLRGRYREHMQDGTMVVRRAGNVVFRGAEAAHRIQLYTSLWGNPQRAWTIFITGPRVREWGFLCPQGWRHWRDFTSTRDAGQIGRGCDD